MDFYHDPKEQLEKYQSNTYDTYDSFEEHDEVVSIGRWIIMLLLLAIPIINIIVALVLAFGVDNQNLRNFGKASLILATISIIFLIFSWL